MMKKFALLVIAAVTATVGAARADQINSVTASTYTFSNSDCDPRSSTITQFNNASGVAATLPQAGASGRFISCAIRVQNVGAGLVTITPTTSTVNGGAQFLLPTNTNARLVSTATPSGSGNYTAEATALASGAAATASVPHTLNANSSSLVQSVCIGVGACSAYPFNSETSGHGVTAMGDNAAQYLTALTSETVAFGGIAGHNVIDGVNNSFFGINSCGADQHISNATCIGNDAGRSMVSIGSNDGLVAVGEGAVLGGKPNDHQVAVGKFALRGASANIVVSGTPTTGDVLHVTFATSGSSPAGMVGLPLTVNYTVTSGDTTIALVAAHLGNAIQSAVSGVIQSPDPGSPGPHGGIEVFAPNSPTALPDGSYAITLLFPGTTTNGWALTITRSTSGGASETLAVRGGTQSAANAAVGGNALRAPAATNVAFNAVVGDGALEYGETASANAVLGNQAANNCTGCANSIFIGNAAGNAQTGGVRNIFIGYDVGPTCATGSTNLLIGTQDCISSSSSDEINIKGLLYYNSNSVAAPALSSCGTNPAIDAHANNRSGTVTMGTGTPTGCVITFAGTGYSSWVHCRVTSQSQLASFAYSTATTAITTVQTATSSNKIDYDCDGY